MKIGRYNPLNGISMGTKPIMADKKGVAKATVDHHGHLANAAKAAKAGDHKAAKRHAFSAIKAMPGAKIGETQRAEIEKLSRG